MTISPKADSFRPMKMSIFSPAERFISMMLPSSSARMSDNFIQRRSSCTSTSIRTFAIWATSSRGVMSSVPELSRNQGERLLNNLILGRDHFRIRLITALVLQQVGELGGDVDR